MLLGNRPAAIAVRLFRCGEYAFPEPGRTLQHFSYARNFDNVYPNGNDHN